MSSRSSQASEGQPLTILTPQRARGSTLWETEERNVAPEPVGADGIGTWQDWGTQADPGVVKDEKRLAMWRGTGKQQHISHHSEREACGLTRDLERAWAVTLGKKLRPRTSKALKVKLRNQNLILQDLWI